MCRIDYNRLEFDLYFDKGYAYIMSRENSIDIDTELDFKMAEYLYNRKSKS